MRSSFFWDVTQRGLVVTDASGQTVGIILKDEGVKDDLLRSLTLEDGIDRLFRNVGNHQSTLCNIPEELICHLPRGRDLKSRREILYLRPLSIPAVQIYYPMGLLGKRHPEYGDRFCLQNFFYTLFVSDTINNKDLSAPEYLSPLTTEATN